MNTTFAYVTVISCIIRWRCLTSSHDAMPFPGGGGTWGEYSELSDDSLRKVSSVPCRTTHSLWSGPGDVRVGWGAQVFVMYSGGGAKQLRSLHFTRWRWGIMIVS